MLDAIRRWLFSTRLERQLLSENERLRAEVNKFKDEVGDLFLSADTARRELSADREVHKRAVAALRDAVEIAVRERDAARAELGTVKGPLRAKLEAVEAAGYTLFSRLEEIEYGDGRAAREAEVYVRSLRDLADDIEMAADGTPPAEEAKP